MKILVIQTSRFGDLLQTTPMLHALRRKYPAASITVLSRYNVMEVYKDNPDVDYVELFNIEEYTERLLNNPQNLYDFYEELREPVNRLKSMNFDMVLNATHDRFSTFLTYLVSSPEIKGMYLSANGRLRIRINGFWFLYLRCTSEFREVSSFNLSDIYKNTIGGDKDTRCLFFNHDADSLVAAQGLLASGSDNNPDYYIGFQLGTSTGVRRWPIKYFAELGNMLMGDIGARIVLLGTRSEKDLGEKLIKRLETEPIDLIGKTDISLLAGILKKLDLLVTNDTGTMHLSEAVGTKCVSLFFESANPFQTGPYGSGHIICSPDLECFPCPTTYNCDDKKCLDLLPAKTIYHLVNYTLGRTGKQTFSLPYGMRAHKTSFNRLGIWDALPLNKVSLNRNDIIRRVYRNMWLRHVAHEGWDDFLDGSGDIQSILTEETRQWSKHYIFKDPIVKTWIKELYSNLDILKKILEKGLNLIEDISLESKKVPFDATKVARKADNLGAIEKEINNLGRSNPWLSQLINLFALELEQIQDGEFHKMLNEWKNPYEFLNKRISLLREEIENIESIISATSGILIMKV